MRTPRRSSASAFRYHPLAAALALALAPQMAAAVTYVVTNANDSGPGSLREAMTEANLACTDDPSPRIEFAGAGPFVISPATQLPIMTCGFGTYTPTIDGSSHPDHVPNTAADGFNSNIPVILDGGSIGVPVCTLQGEANSYGGHLSVVGLEIRNFNLTDGVNNYGIGLCGHVNAYGNRIRNNQFGISTKGGAVGDGTLAGRNVIGAHTGFGIVIGFSSGPVSILGNFVGTLDGSSPAANLAGIGVVPTAGAVTINGNVISGNSGQGVLIQDVSDWAITGNKIGTNAAGTAALPNSVGISLQGSNNSNVISGNTISGNTTYGIQTSADGGTQITNNNIGTNAAEAGAIGNQTGIFFELSYGGEVSGNVISGNTVNGVRILDSDNIAVFDNFIGTNGTGTSALGNNRGLLANCAFDLSITDNVISGNLGEAVRFAGAHDSTVSGNKIGLGQDGTTDIGNGEHGLVLVPGSGSCAEQASNNNTISGNFIANNNGDGVALRNGFGNRLSQNRIYDNGVAYGGKNININQNDAGPLPNDPGDGDSGPNRQQNYPVITMVDDPDGAVVEYMLDSTPSTTFTVEIFSNSGPGRPAGRVWRRTLTVTTNASGLAFGNENLSGDHFSMTATNNATGDSSEFSPIRSVGYLPSMTLSANTLNFGNVGVGAASPQQNVTVTSGGPAPLEIFDFQSASNCDSQPFCYGGAFTCSTTCSTTTPYAQDATCTVSASFTPSFLGTQSTTIYLCDNTDASPHSITLNGTAVEPPPVTIVPSQWDFGSVLVGATSPTKSFAIQNQGDADTPIGTLSTTGAFSLVATNCGESIPPGGECAAAVAFVPTQPGFATGDLVVPTFEGCESEPCGCGGCDSLDSRAKGAKSAADPAPSATAPLFGTGVQNAELNLPSSVNVGAYTPGSAPITKLVTLTNSGNAVLTLSSITASEPFTAVHDCPLNLVPGASCTVTVGFSAGSVGEHNGTLTVVSNAPGGSRAIPISALVQLAASPVIRVAPTVIGFGNRMFGTQSTVQRVTVINDGGSEAALAGMAVGVDFLLVNTTCGVTLAAQSTCFADVAFRPVGFGPRAGRFSFNSNAAGSPHGVEMLGTGCRPFTMSNRSGASSACAP